MWWERSPCSRRTHSFSNPSFKDIETICREGEEDEQDNNHTTPEPSSPSSSLPAPTAAENQKTPRLRRSGSVFHRLRIATSAVRTFSWLPTRSNPPPARPGEKRIVVYHTSLRVVRRTFEDCRAVQSILAGFGLWVDERDLLMDSGFVEELEFILGKSDLGLPQVFVGGRYVGGADQIRQLHETGELKRVVEGCPKAEPGVCQGCGGIRFVLCGNCNGSRKCFLKGGGFTTCSLCNENGLVRCPACC